MSADDILKGKRILAVDDEPDVLDVIEEQLELSQLVKAGDFKAAETYLETQTFDLVILDIMGVKGFALLDLAKEKRVPAVMLTAHSMTPESLQKAVDKGAVSFLPKDELANLSELIAEILEDAEAGKTHWPKLSARMGSQFKELWGQLWDEIRFPENDRISW